MKIVRYIVCMWFFVSVKNFSLIWRRHHCRWGAANFDLCSAFMTIEHWGFFSVPHFSWHEGIRLWSSQLKIHIWKNIFIWHLLFSPPLFSWFHSLQWSFDISSKVIKKVVLPSFIITTFFWEIWALNRNKVRKKEEVKHLHLIFRLSIWNIWSDIGWRS